MSTDNEKMSAISEEKPSGLNVDDGEVLLDYEADEPEEVEQNPEKERDPENLASPVSEIMDEEKDEKEGSKSDAESLEEGEVSDEDEESRKERLKPQPVCRFYSKGQCTWGASCRFVHPGVLDKGNYNMFAPPRPILPADQEPIEKVLEEEKLRSPTEGSKESAPVIRRPETAWERGLRQAKEMKKLSQQRKETDIEYEEKRTTMSLTQAELDRENDYYMRPASPIRDNESDYDEANLDEVPRLRRIAPPPPADFQARSSSRRYPSPSPAASRRYDSPSPPPNRVRRVAPPRSPPQEIGGPRHRRGDEWADPWMRGNEGRRNSRKRSYSSGSSRSSSRSSSSRSRSRSPKRRRRHRSSSYSSRSSRSKSRSRSRSSTPEGIPRRNQERSESPVNRNTAPLQKRLMNLASSSTGVIKNIKKEPEDKNKGAGNLSAADAELARGGRQRSNSEKRKPSRSSSASSRSSSSSRSRSRSPKNNSLRPAVPPEEPLQREENITSEVIEEESVAPQKQQIRMTLKSSMAVSKTANKSVLEKLGSDPNEILENAKAKREENKLKKSSEIKKEKKEKKSAADRREELLKQLKAVENAIAKKRTKISQDSKR